MNRADALRDQARRFREIAERLHDPSLKAQAIELAERCGALARAIDETNLANLPPAPRHRSAAQGTVAPPAR